MKEPDGDTEPRVPADHPALHEVVLGLQDRQEEQGQEEPHATGHWSRGAAEEQDFHILTLCPADKFLGLGINSV